MNKALGWWAVAALFVAGSAGASSFIVPDDAELIAKSNAIVIGTVEGSYVRTGAADGDADVETVYEIRVERGIKGPLGSGELLRVVSPGGEIDGRGMFVPGAARFAQGEKEFLFLTHHKDHWESTDLMLGTFRFVTSSRGEKLLVRDTDDIEASARERSLAGERVRTQAGFVRFVEDRLLGRPAAENYFVRSSATVLMPGSESALTVTPNLSPYTPESYTQKGASALGVRWDPSTAASAINYFRRTGSGSDIGSPDPGIQNGMAAWTNECGSLVNLVLAGTTTTPSGATNASCLICDNVNVIEFNDPQGRIAGSWNGAGTIAITFITFNSASTPNVGANFRQILDADIVFQDGYNPSNEASFPVAITHELGHSIGWRHSNASTSNPNDSANSCNPVTEECATSSDAIMYWLANAGLGTSLQPWDIHAAQAVYPGGTCGGGGPRTRGDFNGDGKADILLRDSVGTIGLWFMNGAAIIGGGNAGAAGSNTVAGIGDFNNDGKADILFRDSGGTIGMWIMNGTAITAGAAVGSPGGSYSVAGVGDFNADGRDDILLRDSLGNLGLWFMNGSTILSGAFVGSPGGSYTVAGVADCNGDGKADILLRDSLGNLGLWIMNGSTITLGTFVGSPGGSYNVAGVGDLDGDGKADIVLQDSNSNLGVWFLNGGVVVSGAFIGAPGAGYTVRAVKDYNGDGKYDILLRSSTNVLGIWLMNGSTIIGGGNAGAPGAGYVAY